MLTSMLWASVFRFLSPTLDAPSVAYVWGGGGNAPSDSAMAGTELSLGMLWASPLLPRAEALVRWEAACDMPGRLYNKNVAFRRLRGGLVPFPVV